LSVSLVLTLIGEDKPGLVELLSQTVADHEGNWLESRMSRMAGRFAGILRASVPEGRADSLAEALRKLETQGLRVLVERSDLDESKGGFRRIGLQLVGADRAGIIRDISRALATRQVNVEELQTGCSSAPMSGELLFTAHAKLGVPSSVSLEELHQALEEIASDLMVDINLEDIPEGESQG
jgi:glycine cleavage system regulatory protein